jgi:formate dehydrogenase major subunit
MDLVKLEIDGRRIIADNRQTILEVARVNGIHSIPTLCHDGQLEPFASCFLCVVKVRGARTLVPACSTKVSAGMIVETDNAEVRRSRKAALELMLSNHYADCIGPCQLACPAGVDIQGYVALAALGKYRDAIQLIKQTNPLPAVCGRVCTRPCEVKGCRRNILDESVGIDYIKRYIADLDLGEESPWRPVVPRQNGKKVAVVGAGPAGLSCAYYLATKGYAVDMFESLPEAGGMLRYGIPEYRLPKEVLDLEINQVLELGVTLKTNVTLGKDFTVSGLKNQGYDSIFLGLGAWDSSKMRVPDEESAGVLPGIEFLKNFGLHKKIDIHGRVLVVGGGNTAIDCARTSLRLGAREVVLVYRRTRNEMPANEMEIVEAEHEGIKMEFLVAPSRVITDRGRVTALECIRMELGEPDASGRRSPKPVRGSEFVTDCDFVIAAIGQGTKLKELTEGRIPNFLPFGETLALTRWQTIQVNDKTFETSVEGVFSGGDVVTGAATAIEAIAAGRKAAHAIDTYIRSGKAQPEPFEFNSKKDAYRKVTGEDLREGVGTARRSMPSLPPEERKKSFVEVEQGYSADDLRSESFRCLECGCVALFDCSLRKYATEYQVDITSFLGEAKEYKIDRTHPLIELDPNKCILCGRCVRMCSDVVGVAAYGFINRGFQTVVRPALGGSLLDTDCVSCGLCIGTCPTGAIIDRIPLAKPGPWKTESVQTICHYCGVGCGIAYDTFGKSLIKVSRDDAAQVTLSNHCKKGRFGYNYIQSPDRLQVAKIRAGRELQEAELDDAIGYAALRLKELTRRYSGDQIAVFVSPRMTNEEIYLAQKFARVALKTHNVTSLANLVNRDLQCPEVVSSASYADVSDAQSIIVTNSNLDEENFVVDLMVKRAIRKGGRLIYVGPEENRVARFAEVFLQCADGRQTDAVRALLGEVSAEHAGVAAERLTEAQAILKSSILKVLIFNKDYRGARIAHDERLFAEAADGLGCALLALREKSNAQGLLDMGADPSWLPGYVAINDEQGIEAFEKEWCVVLREMANAGGANVADLLREKKIKVALVLGEDPFGGDGYPQELLDGLLAAEFLVVADLFATPTSAMANVVLPFSSTAETGGTFTNQERRVQRLRRAIPPIAGLETWEIICRIAAQMGFRFKMKYASVDDVTAEIRRVVPMYGAVAVCDPGPESIWNLADFGLKRIAFDRNDSGGSSPLRPVRTLFLDDLERRFDRWSSEIFANAREAMDIAMAAGLR